MDEETGGPMSNDSEVIGGEKFPSLTARAVEQKSITAYHVTLEKNVDLILGDTFRIPTTTYAQQHGLKFGAGAYFGTDLTYCIKEAANTFAEQYVEEQASAYYAETKSCFPIGFYPSEKQLRAARKLILSHIGLPGNASEWSLGCIEATIDLSRCLIVRDFGRRMEWPVKGKPTACFLPGPSETRFLSTKPVSKYKVGSRNAFDKYTGLITPQYVKHYGYDTAMLHWPRRNSSSTSASTRQDRSVSSILGCFGLNKHRSSQSLDLLDNETNVGLSSKVADLPREVVVFDWDSRVMTAQKVPSEILAQHWPNP